MLGLLRPGARTVLAALAASTLLLLLPAGASAAVQRAPIKMLQARKMAAEPMHERLELAERMRERSSRLRRLARQMQRAGRTVLGFGGQRSRPMVEDEDARHGRMSRPALAIPTTSGATTGPPRPNQRCNDPANDGVLDGQCETAIVRWNNYVVAAWNDGTGFSDGTEQTQGWATSVDGGNTWVDQGKFPLPRGSNWRWSSDPVLAVNPTTGAFYFSALIDSTGANSALSAIGVLKGRFSGSAFSWDVVTLGAKVIAGVGFLDKEWVAVDPANGRLNLSFTNFVSGSTSQIEYVSADSALTSWTPVVVVSPSSELGYVQGSRPIVAPGGIIYVIYYLIGPVDADFFRIAKSVDGGSTFSTPVDAVSFYSNFDTGAPGFNRPYPDPSSPAFGGIQFPSIAVDRSGGPHNGRLYLSWNEALNWYDDLPQLGHLGTRTETEPNDVPTSATPLVVGQAAVGSLAGSSDIYDWYSVALVAGQSVIVATDSLGPGVAVSTRMFATDGATRLTYATAIADQAQLTPDYTSAWVFTAPSAGTYYLRVGTLGSDGRYRLLTGRAVRGGERGRDQRDVFSTHSDDGAAWSTPVRVNNSPVGFDEWLPEVAVGSDGQVFAAWYDWRDAAPSTNGGESNIYLARSSDGGATWAELGATSDARTAWTAVQSNIIPNEGDYLSLTTDATGLSVAWSDGRAGNPDVYMSYWALHEASTLPALVTASAASGQVHLLWKVGSPAGFAAELYRRVSGAATWDSLGTLFSAADGSLAYTDDGVHLGTTYDYRLGVVQGGTEYFYGQVTVVVPSTGALWLAGVRPSPANQSSRVYYVVAGTGAVKLDVLDVNGRRVSSRALGSPTPGVELNIPLTAGERLRPGVYFLRLSEGGASKTKRIVVL